MKTTTKLIIAMIIVAILFGIVGVNYGRSTSSLSEESLKTIVASEVKNGITEAFSPDT